MAFVFNFATGEARDIETGASISRWYIFSDGDDIFYRYARESSGKPMKLSARFIIADAGADTHREDAARPITQIRIWRSLSRPVVDDFCRAKLELDKEFSRDQAEVELSSAILEVVHDGQYDQSRPKYIVSWY
jgi:hypothetical protein